MDVRKQIESKRAGMSSQVEKLMHQIEALDDLLAQMDAEDVAASRPAAPISKRAGIIRPGARYLRKDSDPAKALEVLKQHGQPMHARDILVALNKDSSHNKVQALASQLSNYARNKRYFTKPDPNTFGLMEWADKPTLAVTESNVA